MFSQKVVILFGLLLFAPLFQTNSVVAEVNWSENFQDGNLNDWETTAYHCEDSIWIGPYSSSDAKFNVTDGALTSPHFDAFKDSAHAYH
ncbi:MAG: hypothetical protein ACXAD7_02800, partial [Candidatus Kariarchaeaceae archaeon]